MAEDGGRFLHGDRSLWRQIRIERTHLMC